MPDIKDEMLPPQVRQWWEHQLDFDPVFARILVRARETFPERNCSQDGLAMLSRRITNGWQHSADTAKAEAAERKTTPQDPIAPAGPNRPGRASLAAVHADLITAMHSAAYAVGCAEWFTHMLAERIWATGKPVASLTLAELAAFVAETTAAACRGPAPAGR